MINYELGLEIIDIVFTSIIVIMGAFSWYYIAGFFISFKRAKEATHRDKTIEFCYYRGYRNRVEINKQ